MNKTLLLGLGTLLLFVPAGYSLVEFIQKSSFAEVGLEGIAIPLQVAIGLCYGILTSLIALWIIHRNFFEKERKFYSNLISQLNLNFAGILFLSLCAGIGEEIFFRAGLQPLLGLWPTSVIFVFIHGYLNPFNWRISMYGTVMVFFIAGIGYLFSEAGLIAAITAHTMLDIILLVKLNPNH